MFLALAGNDHKKYYNKLSDSPKHRILVNDKVYAGWNQKLINNGNYY